MIEKGAVSLPEVRATKRGDMDFPLTNGRALALSYLGVWCSMVLCGMVWYGIVLWCGMVWCSVV